MFPWDAFSFFLMFIFRKLCCAADNYTEAAPPVEILMVAFGSPVTVGLGALSRSTPAWEMAVDDLSQKYRPILNISFLIVPAMTCMPVVENSNHILAKWYYELERPG